MYKPLKQRLLINTDSIYYFNHQHSSIDVYSKNCNYVRTQKIDYHLNPHWSGELLQDNISNKVYTFLGSQLFEINLTTGGITTRKKIVLPKKVLINNDHAYVLKKIHNLNKVETVLTKIKLKH